VSSPLAASLLDQLGVDDVRASTVPFDPGYDPATVVSHLEQSGHLMHMLKLSMACWMISDAEGVSAKLDAARRKGVPIVTGGGPFEIAVAQGVLPEYLDLCSSLGVRRVEAGRGFTEMSLRPGQVVSMAEERGLEVEFELGGKHTGPFTEQAIPVLVAEGRSWLDAGAAQLVVEARESAAGVGLFGEQGALDVRLAEALAESFGLDLLIFEAPTKASQFALLDHFGREVFVMNVRLEELLRVEIYRRGLHSDSFAVEKLRPSRRRVVTTSS
jgi:phosphosulfolactate synthase